MTLPKHIAFIVDGNRRWAKKHGLKSTIGHKKAANVVIENLIYDCLHLGIPYITFWVWSTENWQRGRVFANLLFNILKNSMQKSLAKYIRDGIKINTIGDLTQLPKNLIKELERCKQETAKNNKIVATIAINYGGRDEIIRAINRFNKETDNKKLTEKKLTKYLDTANLPDPDLIIRTGGSQRLSGFMLWQSQYSELYFTKTFFPDFKKNDLLQALKDFEKRQRRFGK